MKIGQNLIRKFENGGAVYTAGSDYDNPYNFELYNHLAGLSGDEFQEAMQANFGMGVHENTETGEPYDYSSLFTQYDPLAQNQLGETYSSAIGKAEGKSRNTLEEAFRLARGGNFGGVGSSLKEAFNRSFDTRDQAGDLAMQQYQTGTFDLQSDFTNEFEDLVAQISGYGVPFDSSTIDEDWTMDGGEGEGEGSGEGSWGNVDMDAFCQENPTHHNCADDDWEGADMDAFCEENPTSSYCD